ncbi:protein suppressor of hairy wing isoform X1 [Folsomia candida]|uniref:protein suppressor of hairy wing isoform X1 n=1 Tax=Folsomia candida TaxID=158441 RepID=UPI000B90793B|nr:protein suppressor of hairy wing isoform X1 [Folsomia candida]
MTCANCSTAFGDEILISRAILSTWNSGYGDDLTSTPLVRSEYTSDMEITQSQEEDQDDTSCKKHKETPGSIPSIKPASTSHHNDRIPILEALSIIFEISPLRLKKSLHFDAKEFNDVVQVFKPCWNSTEQAVANESTYNAPDFALCSDCGRSLTVLFTAFRDFVHMLKEDGELGKKLQNLEVRRKELATLMSTKDDGNHVTSKQPRKRGRPPKTKTKINEDNDQPVKNVANAKKRKRPNRASISPSRSASDSESEMKNIIVIKPEPGNAMEMELSDYVDEDEELLHYSFRGGRSSSEDDSPPDSPINMDLEIRPRSPRPVRKTSARNTDWARLYKSEEEEDEDDILPPRDDQHGDIGAGNETEITATEAEGEDGDEEEEQEEVRHPDDVEAILSKVQVAWKEEPQDLEFDDDSDEDYRPDSDLENLIVPDTRSTKRKRVRKKLAKPEVYSMDIFECKECGQVFAHRKSLQIHCRTHFNDGLYSCPTCLQDFPSNELLKRHRRQFHGEYIPYQMKGSNIDFDSLIENAKKYECPVCHELLHRFDLHTHVSEHNVENPWKCPSCPQEFSTLADYTRHKILLHTQRLKHPCSVCNKEFRSSYHVRRHQVVIHSVRSDKLIITDDSSSEAENQDTDDNDDNCVTKTDKTLKKDTPPKRRRHKCTECEKKYFRLDQLVEHLITHGIGEKFQCEICGRDFTHNSSRKRHMLLHADINQHRCREDDCEKAFSRKDHLVRHMDTIHGIKLTWNEIDSVYDVPIRTPKAKEIPCPYCQKMVKRERMKLHLVTHTGERRHVCKQCGLKFGLRTTLRTHIQCVHQDLRRYACNFCDKAFKRSNHLKDHLKIHTEAENKPFQCKQCSRSFRREKNLKSHMVIHFGGKDFVCELCGKSFNRLDNMRAHVRSVHEGIQIRKKRASLKPQGSRTKNKSSQESAEKTLDDNNDDEEHKFLPLENIVIDEVDSTTIITAMTQDGEHASTSSPSITDSKIKATQQGPSSSRVIAPRKPYPGRKRGNKNNKNPPPPSETVALSTILNLEVEPGTIQVPPPGTIVTLATTMGNVISAEGLGLETVQIEEIHAAVEGDDNTDAFDGGQEGQRTTILQLAPGQVFPASSGQYQTTYYQYTYYQQE